MKLIFYPTFTDLGLLTDHYFRLHWYLAPLREHIEKIIVPRRSDDLSPGQLPAYLDESLPALESRLPLTLQTVVTESELATVIDESDCVLVWSADSNEPNRTPPALKGKWTIKIDHNRIRFASSFYLKLSEAFDGLQKGYLERSKQIFDRIRRRCAGDVGYIFGTGPGLAEARDYDFSDGVAIACNSMVRNHDLLDRLKPPLIVIADPIFHAGPSSYAAAFRKELIRALDRHDADLIVPMRDYHIYLHHLPERFTDRIAAIPFKTAQTPNLDLAQFFHVTSTGNVLTLFLLPLAATFFKDIRIFGCDGRPLEANDYFWSHDKASQFNEQMADIQRAHPAFFDIDYDDYYLTHCEILETWLAAAEDSGKRVSNWTPSYIPALAKRSAESVRRLNAYRTVNGYAELISVDPDALSNFGHYLSYDYRLGEDAARRGLKYSIIGNKNFALDNTWLRFPFRKALSVHSWAIGNRPTKVLQSDLDAFASELHISLAERACEQPGERAMLYMYCGSLEHAEIFEAVLKEFPDVDANINLFWTSFVDYKAQAFKERWKPVLDQIVKSGRIRLTVSTARLQNELFNVFGLVLPVAPHPSSTLSDKAAEKFVNTASSKIGARPTVLFPGGMRADKGFDLTVETANRIGKEGHLRCIVRARPGTKLSPAMECVFNSLDRKVVKISDEDVSDDKFVDFLAQGNIIVLPYRAPEFSERTSGLLIDAILLGRPVVVLRDTWLSNVVKQGDVGVAAFDDADNLIASIKVVAENYDVFKNNVEEFRKYYLRKHSWSALVDAILTPAPKPHASTPPTNAVSDETDTNAEIFELEASSVSKQELKTSREELVQELPKYLRSAIFLPTERIPLVNQVEGLRRVKKLYSSELDERYRPRLRALKSRRHRRRCFIIGNGPSLKNTDLSRLKDEDTFVTNGFFLKMPEIDWAPTYYVVEDHLVAEDRVREINLLRGSTKLFPASLRYVLGSDQDTIYFDHRPRISYPHGFDFSFDAEDHTFAGGTVTFTCMQLAAYLGYEEIYLIGVDADYSIPSDAILSGGGQVKAIDMKSDDPNHFHPDYFGKGKRWHEPNIEVMLDAYKEAKRACDARGIKIINATVGGKLEVFPRVDFNWIFPKAKSAPRLLLIDQTPIGDGSATGELKASLFEEWPQNKLLQLYDAGERRVGVLLEKSRTAHDAESPYGLGEIQKAIKTFKPDAILYRPVPHTGVLHGLARDIINESDLPLITWIMDDWPTSYAKKDARHAGFLKKDWRRLLERSRRRLSIGEAMSEAFAERYNVGFEPFANGVSETDWPKARIANADAPVKVRFAGSLAENMTLSSVVMIADAVENLANNGINIFFEIKTRSFWRQKAFQHFRKFKRTSFFTDDLPRSEYHAWLSGADIVIIAYNFDKDSEEYVRYSIANKLPECLACGAALLAIGPKGIATMAQLEKIDCGIRITKADPTLLRQTLAELGSSPEYRYELAEKAQKTAFEEFNIHAIRTNFMNVIAKAANLFDVSDAPRDAHLHVDETAVVAKLLEAREGRRYVMVDVGAHFGTSASYFDKLGWTIYCFEPDTANRAELKKRYLSAENISIDPRAVSDRPAEKVSFFRSEQSTGISGLSAFHPTHKETESVDVTTISQLVFDAGLTRIDFLKIDVEGFDFSVLKGVPWDRLKPEVIECEFEDAKTVPMGHDWRDIANFLKDKGYAVYVSEWHSIVRYGTRHDWRRVIPLKDADMPDNAWGNLLGFLNDPGMPAVRNAFADHIKQHPGPTNASKKEEQTTAAAIHRPLYARFGDWLKKRSPRVFSILRFLRRAAAGLWRRRLWTAPAFVILALLFFAGFFPAFENYRTPIWVGAAFFTIMFIVFYLALRVYHITHGLLTEIAVLRNTSVQQNRTISKLRDNLQQDSRNYAHEVKKLKTQVDMLKVTVDGGLNHSFKKIDTTVNQIEETLRSETKQAKKMLRSEMRQTEKTLRREIENSAKTNAEKLQLEIRQALRAKETQIQKDFDARFTEVTRLRERVSAGERQISVMRYPKAPRCIVLFGHHKCGSRFFRMEIFAQLAEMTGARLRKYEVRTPPFHYSQMDDLDLCNMDFDGLGVDRRDIVVFSNATKRSLEKIKESASDWKGLRIMRDPRQVLVSNYLHHKGDHHADATDTLGWVWDKLVHDKPILSDLPEEEGLLYELDNISKDVIERQLLEPFDDERILTVKLEDFAADPSAVLLRISEFLQVPDIAGINLSATHANRDSGPWSQYFTPRLRTLFKERYGQALIDMGYAADLDW